MDVKDYTALYILGAICGVGAFGMAVVTLNGVEGGSWAIVEWLFGGFITLSGFGRWVQVVAREEEVRNRTKR